MPNVQQILKAHTLASAHAVARKSHTTVRDILRKSAYFDTRTAEFEILAKSLDFSNDQRLVTGQVYAPDTLDAHGHFMSASELQKCAHQFMLDGLQASIDVQHDNELVQASIVESFIARKGDPDFEEGAWVATVKIDDPDVWQAVKDGKLNGYSFEILTFKNDVDVQIEYSTWYYGFTDPDPHDKHDHPFMVRLDENGEIVSGTTGIGSDGSPAHNITKSNITDAVAGKTHRIHFKDQ